MANPLQITQFQYHLIEDAFILQDVRLHDVGLQEEREVEIS
jgi:hypothetical protein